MIPFCCGSLGSIVDPVNGVRWDSATLHTEIQKRIYFYSHKGMTKGQHVVLAHGNNCYFFADLLALWSLNVCCVCVDDNIGFVELKSILKLCASSQVIFCERMSEKLGGHSFEGIHFHDTKQIQDPLAAGTGCLLSSFDLDSPALILFTSGTTGDPKGVVLTFRALFAKWMILTGHMPLSLMDVSLCLLPTHFGHGLICNCLYPLLHGKQLVILPKFRLEGLMQLGTIIDECRATYMSSVPTVWKIALAVSAPPRLNSLKLVSCGSAPLSETLWRQIQEWSGTKRVSNTYGITEAGSWVAGTVADATTPRSGMVGRGWGTKFLITRDKGEGDASILSGEKTPANTEGHIWLSTPSMMSGYYLRPDLTRDVMSGGWFYTGDIGYVHEDGLLFLTGRVRNEINFAGLKVIPEDIDMLLESHESVNEACVFGMDDPVSGQIVAAAIVFRQDKRAPARAELTGWLRERLSDYKVPKRWYVLEDIPKNVRGKVNRKLVAESCTAQNAWMGDAA